MKILIISFYYKPDLSAGSFRTASFVKALKKQLSYADTIEIVTTMPNRYSSFKVEAEEFETSGNVSTKRIIILSHKSGFLDQARSFMVYFIETIKYVRSKNYDAVFATSSRLFSAFLGAIISRQKGIPLYLDIRDIFVDTMRSLFTGTKQKFLIPLLIFIEKYTMLSAYKINLISEGFLPYFKEKYQIEYSFFPNGVDDDFLIFSADDARKAFGDKVVFTYTGNIGEGQGLERIVPQIAQKYKNIEFHIIGDGGRKRILRECTEHLWNVRLFDPVNRKDLIALYKQSDVLFLQLNDYDAFKKVLPSKIFEYAATYKPIIAGVDGYAKEFLKKYLPDVLIYNPCDFDDFCRKYDCFTGTIDIEKRKEFIAKFLRQKIMDEMARDFLDSMDRYRRS
ncbi:MAG: glycosyltransferase family 4 protein [Nitrospirota bacterium]